jgi:hypothetical protein
MKIQSLARRRNVYTKVYESRGATRFRPSPTLYNLYINDTPQTIGVNLALFADDTCLYATERKEGYVLRKVQRGLNSTSTWCERWNIKINEEKTQAIYFSHQRRPLTLFLH